MRTRTLAAAATLTLGFALLTPGAAQAASCGTATFLPDLGHGSGAISFHGSNVVGYVVDSLGNDQPAVWRNGHLQTITEPAMDSGQAVDINSHGDIVGTTDTWSWVLTASGHFIVLKDSDGDTQGTYARRINDRGQISGTADNWNSAAIWDTPYTTPRLLAPPPGNQYGYAPGLNDLGTSAGSSSAPSGAPQANLWDPTGHVHGLDSGFGPGQPADLFQINDRGQSAGESYLNGTNGPAADEATVWFPSGVAHLLGYLPGDNQSTVFGLSNRGYASGVSLGWDYTQQTQTSSGYHAFVWPGRGPMLALQVPGSSYSHSESNAKQIDDDGTAVGWGGPIGGTDRAIVWQCAFSQTLTSVD